MVLFASTSLSMMRSPLPSAAETMSNTSRCYGWYAATFEAMIVIELF